MSEDKRIPQLQSYEEMADFWDEHSLIHLILEQGLQNLELQN